MKQRTPLKQRTLPDYTIGEERMNYISHIAGAAFGVVALILCVVRSALHGTAWDVVGSAIYGVSLIALYTMSGVYHALRPGTAKLVLQVLDHCTIYLLIGGSYTPILFSAIRHVSPVWCWVIFGIVWGLAVFATVFTAIDLDKYATLSMVCYIGMGWCIVMAMKVCLAAMPLAGFWYLLAGGIAYTVGAVLYGLGGKHRYMHSVFHLFVLLGSFLQFITIYCYVLPH
ncbi:MAG: hemolysin III family protein [Clostridia bacterium]|nr:hemolysin III family protein [Clostridia bacterium]